MEELAQLLSRLYDAEPVATVLLVLLVVAAPLLLMLPFARRDK